MSGSMLPRFLIRPPLKLRHWFFHATPEVVNTVHLFASLRPFLPLDGPPQQHKHQGHGRQTDQEEQDGLRHRWASLPARRFNPKRHHSKKLTRRHLTIGQKGEDTASLLHGNSLYFIFPAQKLDDVCLQRTFPHDFAPSQAMCGLAMAVVANTVTRYRSKPIVRTIPWYFHPLNIDDFRDSGLVSLCVRHVSTFPSFPRVRQQRHHNGQFQPAAWTCE